MNRYARTLGAGLLVLGLSGACSSTTTPPPETTPEPTKASADTVQLTLRDTWGSEAAISRVFLLEALSGMPDASWARARLTATGAQAGDLMASFYRPDVAAQITTLLDARTQIILDYAAALRAYDQPGIAAATTALEANSRSLGALLANGVETPVKVDTLLAALLDAQGTLQLEEVRDRINGDYAGATAAHEALTVHVDFMADTLSDLVTNTRPDLVAASKLTADQRATYALVHERWLGHAMDTRAWLVSGVGGLADTLELTNELLKEQKAMGALIADHYGNEAGSTATTYLATHVIRTDDYLRAAKAMDATGMAKARAELYANADDLAKLFARLDPSWAPAKATLKDEVDHTLDQIDARLAHDWKIDLAAFDLAIGDGEKLAALMAPGVAAR